MTSCIVTGASGLLGRSFVNHFSKNYEDVFAFLHSHPIQFNSDKCRSIYLDLENEKDVEQKFDAIKPSLVIHCAGLTNVDLCEDDKDLAHRLNVDSTKLLARLSRKWGSQFVYISTDHLYDGKKSFYCEDDLTSPLNIYAKTKLEGEYAALQENSESLVIRTNFFGKGTSWRQSFTDWIWNHLSKNQELSAFEDSYFTPIAIPLLQQTVCDLIAKKAQGIFNVCGSERIDKYHFALAFSNYFNLDKSAIKPVSMQSVTLRAKRPRDMSLNCQKVSDFLGYKMPTILQSFDSIKSDYIA